jgi:amino acid permease
VERVLGRWGFYLINLGIILRNLGALIIYCLIIGDFWEGSLVGFGYSAPWVRPGLLALSIGVLVIPLGLIRSLNRLWLANLLGGLVVFYLVICLGYDLATRGVGIVASEHLYTFTPDILRAAAINLFAFSATTNVIPIWTEDPDQSPHFITVAQLLCLLIYVTVGSIGFLVWGEAVTANILDSYLDPARRWQLSVPAVYTVEVIFSCIVVNFVLRLSLLELWRHLSGKGGPLDPSDRRTYWRLVLAGTVTISVSYALAVSYRRIEVVFTITGSLFSAITAVITPTLIYGRHFWNELSPARRLLSSTICLLGVTLGVAAFIFQLATL